MEIEKAAFPGNKGHLCKCAQKTGEKAKTTFRILGQVTVSHIKNLCAICPAVAAGERARLRFGFKNLCRARLKTYPLQTAELHAI